MTCAGHSHDVTAWRTVRTYPENYHMETCKPPPPTYCHCRPHLCQQPLSHSMTVTILKQRAEIYTSWIIITSQLMLCNQVAGDL